MMTDCQSLLPCRLWKMKSLRKRRPLSESSADLTAATVAGVAALSIDSLWDKADKSSPLIDMLNKLPTAIIVSSQGKVLFASENGTLAAGIQDA